MLKSWNESVRAMIFVSIATIGIYCIILLTWYWGIEIRYDDAIWDLFKEATTEKYQSEGNKIYEVVEDGYRYRVYGTGYLASAGYACIGAETGWLVESERGSYAYMSEKEDANVVLNIGFKIFHQYSFQLDIESVDGRYQIDVDRHGNLIIGEHADPNYKKKINGIMEQNRAEIDRLFYHANEKWNIQ